MDDVQELQMAVVRHEEQIKTLFRVAQGIETSLGKIAENGVSRAGDKVRIEQHAAQIRDIQDRLDSMRSGFEGHFKDLARQISELQQHRAGITSRQAILGAGAVLLAQFLLTVLATRLG